MFLENLRFALRSLLANKMRSILTMLGIIIGVGAVVAMISIGRGATQAVTEQFAALGANVMTVRAGVIRPAGGGPVTVHELTYEDYLAVKDADLPGVVAVTAMANTGRVVQYGGNNTRTGVLGTTPAQLFVRNAHVAQGRFINQYDVVHASRVAVLGATTVEDIFGEPSINPVGKTIRVGNENFAVIGVLEEIGGFTGVDRTIIAPVTTVQKRLTGSREINTIDVKAANPQVLPRAEEALKAFLTRRMGDPEKFNLTNLQQILDQIETSTQMLTILLAGITGISLLVGGIGIMNIMLVSVTERTREIGIRKAIGAKRRHILSQFVLESILLSLIGGAIGIALGIWGANGISSLGGWDAVISLQAIVLAVGFSGAVGLFFGIYPANKASKLDPIDALRYE